MTTYADTITQQPENKNETLIKRIFRVHPDLVTREDQRNSRLLSRLSMGIVLLAATLFLVIFIMNRSWLGDPDTIFGFAGAATLTIPFLLNRAGKLRLATILFLTQVSLITVAIPFFPASQTYILILTILPVLLAAFLAERQWVPMIGTTIFVLLIVLTFIFRPDAASGYITSAILIEMVYGMIFAYTRYQNEMDADRIADLEQTVDERTYDLRVAKEEAEQANMIKSQFLASMSHELRTPLNAILSFNKLHAVGAFGPVTDEQVTYLNKTMDSGKHLLSLINDVLDVSKIQSGMLSFYVEDDFDIEKESASVTNAIEKMLVGKPVKMILDVDKNLPELTCDKRRIRQVMLNLLSNAAKFTEEGTITVSAKHSGDDITFAVSDTGPGIPEDQMETVFEPFIQTEEGVKHAGGTGLGLPISKSIIEGHKGSIWAESDLGEGSSFYFTLPLVDTLPAGDLEA